MKIRARPCSFGAGVQLHRLGTAQLQAASRSQTMQMVPPRDDPLGPPISPQPLSLHASVSKFDPLVTALENQALCKARGGH